MKPPQRALSNKEVLLLRPKLPPASSAVHPNTGVARRVQDRYVISHVDVTIRDNICYGFGLDAADLLGNKMNLRLKVHAAEWETFMMLI